MPRFLDDLPRFLFLTGKGGVGKTSVACATAVTLARQGHRVLLVSTDPASNVAQVLGTTIGHRITPITAVPGLDALEIDPEAAAEEYRRTIIDPVRLILPAREIETITEQLSGSCTTEVATFNEFTSLLAEPEATVDYDHVVWDTAPTGHTIRLLQLPGSWTGYLDAGKGDASCLGPMSGLEKNRAIYRAAVDALTDPTVTRMVLVARAQESALREAARSKDELDALGICAQHLVINGVLSEQDGAETDPLHEAVRAREEVALDALPPELAGMTRDVLPLRADDVVGIGAVERLLDTQVEPLAQVVEAPEVDLPGLGTLLDQLGEHDHGLIMTMGKGGVGKTTVASAIALGLAARGKQVLLTTTDPAAHVATTLAGDVPGLEVQAIDPEEATRVYREHVMATRGAALDDDGRAALAEDLRSPCTEEIAVFQQFSRAVNQARRQVVVMDTAPTGHTLLLMDATGAYHRDVTRHLDEDARERLTTPLMRLQDPEHTRVVIVTLPQTTPVAEARSLVSDLERASIRPWAWVVNNSLAAAQPTSPLLAAKAHAELPLVEAITTVTPRLAVIPAQAVEPVGGDRLRALDA